MNGIWLDDVLHWNIGHDIENKKAFLDFENFEVHCYRVTGL